MSTSDEMFDFQMPKQPDKRFTKEGKLRITISDVSVLKAMSKVNALTSRKIAAIMNVSVFQITARLASMEKRKMVARRNGAWVRLKRWQDIEKMEMDKIAYENALKKLKAEAKARGTPEPKVIDDDVPQMLVTTGWTMREYPYNSRDYVTVFHDPETGTDYVHAESTQRADLIRVMMDGIPNVRLVEFTKGNKKFDSVNSHARALRQLLKDL
jgi:hypothetical protein